MFTSQAVGHHCDAGQLHDDVIKLKHFTRY